MTRRWSLFAIILIIIGLVGMAYQHFEFDEPLVSYEQRWDLSKAQLDNLSVDSDFSTDVEFIQSEDGSSYVELSGELKQPVIDRLKQTMPSSTGLALDIKDRKFEFLSIQFHSPKQHMIVALPKSAQVAHFQLNFGASSGSIDGLKADTAELKVLSGRLNVTNATASQLTLKAASGSISAEQIKASLTASLQSGGLTLKDITGDGTYSVLSGYIKGERINGQVQMKATSGNITLNDFTGDGQLQVSSGNITLNGQRSDHLDISASSGNVKLSKDEGFQGFYDLQATSGSVHAPESPQKTNDVIKVRTHSGNISIS